MIWLQLLWLSLLSLATVWSDDSSSPSSLNWHLTIKNNSFSVSNPLNNGKPKFHLFLDEICSISTEAILKNQDGKSWKATTDETELKISPVRSVTGSAVAQLNVVWRLMDQLDLALLPQKRICLHATDSSQSPWFIFNSKFSQPLIEKFPLRETFYLSVNSSNSPLSPAFEPILYHSGGFALILDDLRPWHFHFAKDTTQFCFYLSEPLLPNPPISEYIFDHLDKYYTLKWTIVVGENLQKLHQFLLHSGRIKRPQAQLSEDTLASLFKRSVVPYISSETESINKSGWNKLLKNIAKNNLKQQCNIHLSHKSAIASNLFSKTLELDISHDDKAKKIFDLLDNIRNEKNLLSLSVKTQLFRTTKYDKNAFFLKATTVESTFSDPYFVPDFSKENEATWFKEKLQSIFEIQEFDAVFCEGADFRTFLSEDDKNNQWLVVEDGLLSKYPNFLSTLVGQACQASGASQLFTTAAYKSQQMPQVLVIQTDDDEGYLISPKSYGKPSKGLQRILRKVLAASLAGYSLLMAQISFDDMWTNNWDPSTYWQRRWLELVAFMPVMQIPFVGLWAQKPSQVKGTLEAVLKLRQERLVPTFVQLAKQWLKTGEPIIRPLWYNFPADQDAFEVDDQFMIGTDILVAPILVPMYNKAGKSVNRKVYFPASTNWIQPESNLTYIGGAYRDVPLPNDDEEFPQSYLPYFVKVHY